MASVYDTREIVIEKAIRTGGFRMKQDHSHTCCELYYLKSGSCTFQIEGIFYHVYPGEMIIVAPNALHNTNYTIKSACERIMVNYYPEDTLMSPLFMENALNEKLVTSGKIIFHEGNKLIEQIFDNMLSESSYIDQYHSEFMSSMLRLLFLLIGRYGHFSYNDLQKNGRENKNINMALDYIVRNYAEPLTLNEVAAYVGLAPSYFSMKMKKVTGMTFKHYLLMIRLKAATRRLLNTEDTITFIATECGFNSSNYFKDCFRRYKGVSPSTFRKKKDSFVNDKKDDLLQEPIMDDIDDVISKEES